MRMIPPSRIVDNRYMHSRWNSQALPVNMGLGGSGTLDTHLAGLPMLSVWLL